MALKLDKAGRLKLSEADVVKQVEDLLTAHGWRCFVTGYGEIHREGEPVSRVGEIGMPDRLFIRYKSGCYAEVIWCEFKRPKCPGDSGGRLRKEQALWLCGERMRGAPCVVVDSLSDFQKWYRDEIGDMRSAPRKMRNREEFS